MAFPSPMLTREELAALLKVKPRYVLEKAASREWPSHYTAGIYLFDEQDVRDIYELIRTPEKRFETSRQQAAPQRGSRSRHHSPTVELAPARNAPRLEGREIKRRVRPAS